MFVAATNTIRLESDAGGEHIDPRADDVLATMGAGQRSGRYLLKITICAISLDDSKAMFEIRHRNAADDDTLESAIVAVPVDDCRQFEFGFALDDDEQIVVVPYPGDMIGTVTVAINWQRIS